MSHATAKLLLALSLAVFFGPLLVTGKVLFAHDNAPYVGLPADQAGPASNYKFADQSHVYLPQIQHQLDGESEGWIATWDPHTQLGRPAWHSSGLSKSFAPFHVFSWLFDDPLRLYTALAVTAISLAAIFGYLFLQALGLLPAACLFGSLGLSLGVFPSYWLSFVMFIWGIAWTLGCLWLVTLFLRRPSLASGLGLAFCIHAQLLSGYPQQTLWHGYVVAGFCFWRLWRDFDDWGARAKKLLLLGTCLLVALLSVLPTFLELGLAMERSGRADTDPSFFLRVLPKIESLGDFGLFTALFHDAFWFGNPITAGPSLPRFPRFNGVSLAPVAAGLFALVLAHGTWRRAWPALVLIAVATFATLVPAVYEFGVRYFGLGISRYIPLAGVWIPLIVVAAVAADGHLRSPARTRGQTPMKTGATAWPLVALAAAPGAIAALGATLAPGTLDPVRLATSIALSAGTLVFVFRPRPLVLSGLACAGALVYGLPLQLGRAPASIHTESPLVELARRGTDDGSRFAWVLPNVPGRPTDPVLLPPNQENLLGLRSIHSYDSLSSRSYQTWVRRISTQGTFESGRYFKSITSTERLVADELALAGIGLLLTPIELDPSRFTLVQEMNGLRAYRPSSVPLLFAQVDPAGTTDPTTALPPSFWVDRERRLPLERTLSKNDRMVFRTTPSEHETLLVVSQQHHPRWRAHAGDQELATFVVAEFYQGVRIPAGTNEVELCFQSPVRWSWVPQLAFGLAALVLTGLLVLRRRTSSPHYS